MGYRRAPPRPAQATDLILASLEDLGDEVEVSERRKSWQNKQDPVEKVSWELAPGRRLVSGSFTWTMEQLGDPLDVSL